MAVPHDGATRLRSLEAKACIAGRWGPAAVIFHSKSGRMPEGRTQDPFAIAARPSCDDGGGRVCTSAHPVAGTVEQRLAAAKDSPVARLSGDQARVARGGDQDKIGVCGHMRTIARLQAIITKPRTSMMRNALVGRPLGRTA
jgi:hypothetical protein